MFLTKRIFLPIVTQKRFFKVTVLGATSEVSQVISLLLRKLPDITTLSLHDNTNHAHGVVLDVSHIPEVSQVCGYTGEDHLQTSLKNSDIVILSGGSLNIPGQSENAWFSANANFIQQSCANIAKLSPMPFVGIVTEPINSTVPMAAEVIRNNGNYDAKKLFGITNVDLFRAQCLYAFSTNYKVEKCFVPVIGGRSPRTIVPLLSQARPACPMDQQTMQQFTEALKESDTYITKGKKGWPPTLSVAHSTFAFVQSILQALQGKETKVNALVEDNEYCTHFFSGQVTVNEFGYRDMERYTCLSGYESNLLQEALQELRKDVYRGKKILEYAEC